MYLKKIEAQGFKSFANKTVLEFDPGIMGIVGPNGSGKSNISDAIRWVLGEQSAKQLRGSNMQDVIFSGTEHRKAMGFASVSLTIDNSDRQLGVEYPEVVVCRRVYRSGDSEYILNGTPCRLKDISELFYDTGVGRDGYSIIGQGQVEKVLSGRPEDRRELFDEAAGIVKYKKRKLIAQKKLENEDQNLIRITDILGELEKQIGPLNRQSEKAREYLKLKGELKKLEVGAFYMESSELRKKLDDVNSRLEIVRNDYENSSRKADEARELYEDLEAQNTVLEQDLDEKRTEAENLRLNKEKLDGIQRLLEEQAKAAERDDKATAERLNSLREEAAGTQESLEAARKSKKSLEDEIVSRESEYSEHETVIESLDEEISDAESSSAKEDTNLLSLMNKKTAILSELQKNAAELELAQSRESESDLADSSEEEERRRLLGEKNRQEHVLKDLRENIKKLEESIRKLEAKLSDNRADTAGLYSALDDTRKRFHTENSRLETLQNISERYEGYGQSVRRVMEKKSSTPGICGVVADLIHVDKKYETAIETALGGRLQDIITDTESTAQSMVDYLKKNRFGRATFLPLTDITLRGSISRPEALKETGAIGLASSLVRTDERYEVIAKYLLGRILVADSAANALSIARKYGHSLSIVTLEGEYFAPGGSLTGGAYKTNSNLLGRRREIEELGASVQKLQEEIEELQSSIIENTAKKGKLNEELAAQNDAIQGKRLEEAEEAGRLRQTDEKLEEIDENKRLRLLAANELKSKIEQLRTDHEALDAAVKNLENEIEKATEKRSELVTALSGLREKKAEAEKAAASLQADLSALRERDNTFRDELFRMAREKDRIAAEIDAVEKSRSVRESAEEKRKEIESVRQNVDETEKELTGLTERINELSSSRDRLQRKLKEALDSRMSLAEAASHLDKDLFRLEGQKERLDGQLEQQIEYLWTEYGMTPTEAEAEKRDDGKSLRELRRTISQNKEAIRELGPVNVNAIEEYKEVSTRYEFLKGQHEDLTKAKTELEGIIKELDDAMRTQFKEKFTLIQTEFNHVFSELFGGGKGTLELTGAESGDLLDSGIAIIAQPPGKRLQNMMQLSGGEKALTAIALLFAIQNLKPSPFCLLDEIEAALDEPNVIRFADYLQKLKGHTQFIVITHRRGTMEVSERLYGVTMQEKGVSTLVSVNLSDPSLYTE